MKACISAILLFTALTFPAMAEGNVAQQPIASQIVQISIALAALSLGPALLVTTTSFTRFVISLSFLRNAFGIQGVPANITILSLSLILTVYVMGPSLEKAWERGVRPYIQQQIDEVQAIDEIVNPFRAFMTEHTRAVDRELFENMAVRFGAVSHESLRIVIPAFMISELRRGLEIGVLITLPFLAIDICVAIILMAAGMMMMPPSVVSLPLKIMFFVYIDGWNVLISSLVKSFG